MRKIFVLLIACLLFSPVYTQCPDINNEVVFINEIHYDNIGADVNEGVEIAGPAGTNLAGFSLVFYNGANDMSYHTEALAGVIPNLAAGYGTIWFPIANIQNGSVDGVALYNGNTFTLVQFLSYGGSFTAANDVAVGVTSEDIGVAEDGSSTPTTSSLQLTGGPGSCPSDFNWVGPAAGSGFVGSNVNTGQTFVATGTCILTGLTITQSACVDLAGVQVANIEVDFNYYNVGGPNFLLQISPDPAAYTNQYTYTSLPLSLNTFLANGTAYTFIVSDVTDPTCQLAFTVGETFNCPTATILEFSQEPEDCVEPNTPFEVTVCAVDGSGEIQTTYGLTISLGGLSGGTVTGTTSMVPVDGCATFTLTSSVAQTLNLTATDGAGPLADGASNPIDIVAECPAVSIITGVINPCGEDSQNEYIAASTNNSAVDVADMIFASINPTAGTQPNVNYTWSATGTETAGSTTELCGTVGLQCNRILDINDVTDGPIIGNLINDLNLQAGCPGLFVAPTGGAGTLGTIPANSNFIFFLGAGGNQAGILPGFDVIATNMDFSTYCGTGPIYAIFGYHNNPSTTLGFFSNAGSRTYQVIVDGNISTDLTYPTPSGTLEAETFGSDLLAFSGADCVPTYLFGATVLAPEFLDFSGEWTLAAHAQLEWILSESARADHFVIERSQAAGTFHPIGELSARSDEVVYAFRDVQAAGSESVYRIKMVLPDGDFRYSDQIALSVPDSEEPVLLSVYPNPAHDLITFALRNPEASTVDFILTTLEGKRILRNRQKTEAGHSQHNIPLNQVSPGLYLYQIQTEGFQKNGLLMIE